MSDSSPHEKPASRLRTMLMAAAGTLIIAGAAFAALVHVRGPSPEPHAAGASASEPSTLASTNGIGAEIPAEMARQLREHGRYEATKTTPEGAKETSVFLADGTFEHSVLIGVNRSMQISGTWHDPSGQLHMATTRCAYTDTDGQTRPFDCHASKPSTRSRTRPHSSTP